MRKIDAKVLLIFALVMGICVVTVGLLATKYYPLAIMVAPGVLFFYCLFKWPELGVFTIAAFVPFDEFRGLEAILGSLTVPKLVGAALLGILFIRLAENRRAIADLRSPVWPWLILFLAINGISAALSDYQETAINGLRQILIAVLVMISALAFLRTRQNLIRLTDVVIGAVSFSAALSIVGYFFEIELFTMGVDTEHELKRSTGGSADPNVFACLIIFAFPMAVRRAIESRTGTTRLAFAAVVGALALALFLSQSRSGFLVFLLLTVLLAVQHRHLFNARNIGMIIALGIIGGTIVFSAVPKDFFERQLSVAQFLIDEAKDRSLNRRSSYWTTGIKGFFSAPVLGHGPDTFQERYAKSDHARSFVTKFDDNLYRHAHNTYIEVIVGSGILGFALFIGILVTIWRCLKRAAAGFGSNGDSEMASIAKAWQMSFLGLLLFFVFISQINLKFFWLLAAVAAISLRLSAAKRGAQENRELDATAPYPARS